LYGLETTLLTKKDEEWLTVMEHRFSVMTKTAEAMQHESQRTTHLQFFVPFKKRKQYFSFK
jgi:hypothetical protein